MKNLSSALIRLAQIQGEAVDKLALLAAVESVQSAKQFIRADARRQLLAVTRYLQVKAAEWVSVPDPAAVPALVYSDKLGWGILRGLDARQCWVVEWFDGVALKWVEAQIDAFGVCGVASLRLGRPFDAAKSPVFKLIKLEIFSRKGLLLEVCLGGVVVNFLALATSFYSMQVYDRVVPTGASATLMVLTLGVIFAAAFEFVAKHVRSGLYELLVDRVDQRLSRAVYMRFLAVRLDQLPVSVGGLAAQLRGYETVRSFLTSLTSSVVVDIPFALVFFLLIALISGWLALIPVAFFGLSLIVGIYYRGRVNEFAGKATAAGNMKTGLLVESIEGAETIKSGQGGWRMLSRWMKASDEARDYEQRMRRIQEHSQHLMGVFQQLSYVLLVASGALLIGKGDMTMGGLIACSILAGRVLTPVGMIPNQLVQWAHSKAALVGLDRLWMLKDDHHGCEQPLVPAAIDGNYCFEGVGSCYGDNKALDVERLVIRAGEKIGVLGPIGGGKTTFLRLLSGMYKPQNGRILLDGVDLSHISKPLLAEYVGYLQQDGRLFAGTLRDNLILGMIDPGDDVILAAAKFTGLMDAVIGSHPKGLQQDIFEGGNGLSGGQRQLVNLTRVFLRKPAIWLLDEPTASLDVNLEGKVIAALKQTLRSQDTVVLVTHKTSMLEVVDRLLVIVNHQIIMDGPKQEVLARLFVPSPSSDKVHSPAGSQASGRPLLAHVEGMT